MVDLHNKEVLEYHSGKSQMRFYVEEKGFDGYFGRYGLPNRASYGLVGLQYPDVRDPTVLYA